MACSPLGLRIFPVLTSFKPTRHGSRKRERQSSTFVSKHVEVPLGEVEAFLLQRKMAYRVSGNEVVVKECPFCHETGGKLDNLWKLNIGLHSG